MSNKIKEDLLFTGEVLLLLLAIALINTAIVYPVVNTHYSLLETLSVCYFVVVFTTFIYCLMTDRFH